MGLRFRVLTRLKAINLLCGSDRESYSEREGLFVLGEPLTNNPKYRVKFDELKRLGYWYVGISSYENFPEQLDGNGSSFFDDPDHTENLIGWLHCQRDLSTSLMPSTLPALRFSESDLCDKYLQDFPDSRKRYDFLYNCQKGPHQKRWRNWSFAVKCLEAMVFKFDLRVLLVGKEGDEITEAEQKLLFHRNVTMTGFLPYQQMLRAVKESRSVFVPSLLDASPRILSEALCLDVPILLNESIFGGWHYLNDRTGTGFTEGGDFEGRLERHLLLVKKGHFRPKNWYLSHYGNEAASKKLEAFLASLPRPLYLRSRSLPVAGLVGRSEDLDSGLGDIARGIGLEAVPPEGVDPEKTYLFATRRFRVLDRDRFLHYTNLFLKFHQGNPLVLSSLDEDLQSTNYLYMSKSLCLRGVSGIVAPGSFSDWLLPPVRQTLGNGIDGYVLKPGIVEPDLDDGWIIKNEFLRESVQDFREMNGWTYCDQANGRGFLNRIEAGRWCEVKNGHDHCSFDEILDESQIVLLHETSKKLHVKLNAQRNSAKAYFREGSDWHFMFDLNRDSRRYLFKFSMDGLEHSVTFDGMGQTIAFGGREAIPLEVIVRGREFVKLRDGDGVEYLIKAGSIDFGGSSFRGRWLAS
jgi:hypothetical protein